MGSGYETQAAWDAGRIAELRQRLGLSQQEFARLLGVRQQTISEWETGLHAPRGTSNRVLNMAAEQAARYETRPARGKR
ncbi:MAG: helix-turn-helix domain-containing protein, partial [Dehalococcoidia bacterium]